MGFTISKNQGSGRTVITVTPEEKNAMVNNPKVHIIPPVPPKRDKRVGIYCRVSTNSSEQLKSLTAQV